MHLKKFDRWIEAFIVVFLFLFITLIVRYFPGHEFDNYCWKTWSIHIYRSGLPKAYESGTDYLPFYQYIMYLFGKIAGSQETIERNINLIRSFTLLFDFAGIWFVYKWIDKKISFLLLLLFSILNIAYSYNTIFWGQTDGIMSTMIFISLYFAHKKKMILSSVWLVLALNMKLQAIIFLPVWGLLYLNNAFTKKTFKAAALPIAGIIMVQILILIPFMLQPEGFMQVWDVAFNSVDKYPKVSMNAYNFWYFFVAEPFTTTDDGMIIGNLSYKNAGLILFFSSSLLALFPLVKKIFQARKGNNLNVDKKQVWLTCSLIALLFFFFNTQMHERYCHPAFIFITAYAFYSKEFLAYTFFSLAYFLNMEGVLKFLQLNDYSWIFDAKFIASLFAITIIILFVRLYKRDEKPVHSL